MVPFGEWDNGQTPSARTGDPRAFLLAPRAAATNL